MIYSQACQAISSNVFIVPIDDFLAPPTEQQFSGSDGVVVNISGGLTDIDLTSVIPCLATHLGLPIFPAGTKQLVTTHDKLLCKYLATTCGLTTARTLSLPQANSYKGMVIEKPISGGDSIGISAYPNGRKLTEIKAGHFVEEFIEGYDATLHVVRNDDGQTYTVLDHLISGTGGTQWFDFASKNDANRIYGSYKQGAPRTQYHHGITQKLLDGVESLLRVCGSPFIARIDFRQLVNDRKLEVADCVFLEVNVAPTISHANDWQDGLNRSFNTDPLLVRFNDLPIHPAASSLSYLISKFYVQSLSIAGKSPVFEANFPK